MPNALMVGKSKSASTVMKIRGAEPKEGWGAVMVKALETNSTLAKIHIRRDNKRGRVTVFAGDDAIATCVPESVDVQAKYYLWNPEALTSLELDKAALVAKAMELIKRPEDSVQWCL